MADPGPFLFIRVVGRTARSALHGHGLDAAALAHRQHAAVTARGSVLPAVRFGSSHLHVELMRRARLLALGRLCSPARSLLASASPAPPCSRRRGHRRGSALAMHSTSSRWMMLPTGGVLSAEGVDAAGNPRCAPRAARFSPPRTSAGGGESESKSRDPHLPIDKVHSVLDGPLSALLHLRAETHHVLSLAGHVLVARRRRRLAGAQQQLLVHLVQRAHAGDGGRGLHTKATGEASPRTAFHSHGGDLTEPVSFCVEF